MLMSFFYSMDKWLPSSIQESFRCCFMKIKYCFHNFVTVREKLNLDPVHVYMHLFSIHTGLCIERKKKQRIKVYFNLLSKSIDQSNNAYSWAHGMMEMKHTNQMEDREKGRVWRSVGGADRKEAIASLEIITHQGALWLRFSTNRWCANLILVGFGSRVFDW